METEKTEKQKVKDKKQEKLNERLLQKLRKKERAVVEGELKWTNSRRIHVEGRDADKNNSGQIHLSKMKM